jgi:RNA polymerase sigma-70 factor, ECF subfamily
MSKDEVFQATTISRGRKRGLDFEPYLDGLYGYALALSRNDVDAKDLVQETYVRAIQAVQRLRNDSNVKAWLFTILRNIWINQCRRRPTVSLDTNPEEEEAYIPDPAADPHDLFVLGENRERVQNAIQRLPANLCEIILLREYEELSYREIADVLSCPIGTVMSRLKRARLRLRTLLSE